MTDAFFEEGYTWFLTHPDMKEHLRNMRDAEGNRLFSDDHEFQLHDIEEDDADD